MMNRDAAASTTTTRPPSPTAEAMEWSRSRADPNLEVNFTCNVCGSKMMALMGDFDRDLASCTECDSSVRFRSLIHLLSTILFDDSMPLPNFPIDKSIVGVGLSDAALYAASLAERVDYLNTYYHAEPFLDITAPPSETDNTLDFMISSDVFEHVPPPVSLAFAGAFRMLKAGGHILLTVPFTNKDETTEHFPDLDRFEIYDFHGEQVLINRDRAGKLTAHDGLVFHGGGGTTLEMRIFSGADLKRELASAGFEDITIFDKTVPEFGIFHSHPWSLPIVARKPFV